MRASHPITGILLAALSGLVVAPPAADAQISVDGQLVETKPSGLCGLLVSFAKQRYIDCLDGTVYDTQTRLVWLKNGQCTRLGIPPDGSGTWRQAMEAASSLGSGFDCDGDGTPDLTDGSQPGDWRLPTRWEWFETTLQAEGLGCESGSLGGPALTNDAGDDCWGSGPSSLSSPSTARDYWSSTSPSSAPAYAYAWSLDDGDAAFTIKAPLEALPLIWPVRELAGYFADFSAIVEDSPVETAAQGQCPDKLGLGEERYVDCENGTVWDTLTGVLWLKDSTCLEPQSGNDDYIQALVAVADLADGTCGLTDGSQPGDWRLPTEDEWDEMTDRAVDLGCVAAGVTFPIALTDTNGTDCWVGGTGGQPFDYLGDAAPEYRFWTSESWFFDAGYAKAIRLDTAAFSGFEKSQLGAGVFPWPVRAGRSR